MVSNKKYRIGLALSGGGAKGFAHIGALRLMEEYNIVPDVIAGTSAGSIAGVLFADGYSSAEIQEIFTGRELSEFARLKFPKDGLLDSERFRRFLEKHLRARRFEELKIPLVVVATDLDNGRSHEFRKGPIADAVAASCSIPVVFSPVEIDGVHYVDGGVFRNFPVSVIRRECEYVIGVNVSPFIPARYRPTIIGIAERSFHYLFRANTIEDRRLCDVLIETEEAGTYRTFDLESVAAIADIGYDAAVAAFNKAIAEQCPPFLKYKSRLNRHKYNNDEMKKTIIYQTLPRLFGNMNPSPVRNGDLARNGAGKFSAFSPAVLNDLKALGITHVWFTGVIEHATQTDYSFCGIAKDHPAIVKGKAGSPYAIKDYYDVDPDLAENPHRRMAEFEELVRRSHEAGLRVIIDFVPNHVARQYKSDVHVGFVDDLGEKDDVSIAFSPRNNFYYIPGQPFALNFFAHNEGVAYGEFPARATGNNLFSPAAGKDDWYETVKLNYGVNYADGGSKHFEPVPDTWRKMLDILRFWASKGVDGFRCDMAEMVPVEFWAWVIPEIRKEYSIVFIGEVYNPAEYRNFIANGQFDFLYDKVGLYDILRDVICRRVAPREITRAWQSIDGLQPSMLNFLENHDEQRIASDFFAADPWAAIPAMIVAAFINSGPVMIYNGQELGERGMDEEGFSGRDGRTSIFDYWSMESVREWLKDELPEDRKRLRAMYACILNAAQSEQTVVQGSFFDLMYANEGNPRFDAGCLYAFMRAFQNEAMLVAVNFGLTEQRAFIRIPREAFDVLNIKDNGAARTLELFGGETSIAALTSVYPFETVIPPRGGVAVKFTYL